jgi:hypothetical protein
MASGSPCGGCCLTHVVFRDSKIGCMVSAERQLKKQINQEDYFVKN